RRGEREEASDRGCDPVANDEGDRLLPAKQETMRPRFRLVDRDVVDGDRYAELVQEAADQVRHLFAPQPCAAADLQAHAVFGMRAREIILGRRPGDLFSESHENQSAVAPAYRTLRACAWSGSSRSASSSSFRARPSSPRAGQARAPVHQASAPVGAGPGAASTSATA